MLHIRIPATSANLGAGFDALGLAVSHYNYVRMEEADGLIIRSCDDTAIPTDESNLVYISAQTVYLQCGKTLPGLVIEQENNIPMTRGLGSSSACIIAGMVGANMLLGQPMGINDLVDLAATVEGHPDNTTPALLGGIVTSVLSGGRVHWVKQEVDEHLRFVALIPDFEMKTSEARACLPHLVPHRDAVYNLSRAALFSASLLSGKYENLRAAVGDRLHQPYRMPMIGKSQEVFDAAYAHGAYAAYVSGAGPTLMAIVSGEITDFVPCMRHELDMLGLTAWEILDLSIDNRGTEVIPDD